MKEGETKEKSLVDKRQEKSEKACNNIDTISEEGQVNSNVL